MLGTLLRSETTQPPEERLLYTEERTESRGANTRIWENVYEVPVLDADGEPTGATETERRRYYEKATNLCYRENAEGPWLPSEPVFENSTLNPGGFAITRAPIRVEMAAGIGDGAHLVCTEDGHSTRFSLRGLGYYERTTGQLVILAEPESVSPIKVADDLIRYPGVFPGCDIDYYYDLTGVQQRVRLASYAMGAPQSYGLDPANTLLVAVSDLSFDEDGVTARVEGQERQTLYEGDDIPIDFSRDEKRLFTLAKGRAWDEGGSYWTGHPVYKHLTTEQGGAQLIEGVPYTWLTNGEREYPVTVDYIIRTGSAAGSEVWRSGNTYYVSGGGWSGTVNPTVSHQAYHGAAVTFDYGTAPTPIPITPYPYDTANRANGSFYLAVTTPAHPCRDGGSRTASAAGLDEKTVDAPIEHNTNITTAATWNQSSTDSATVDIGFHHDRVDHIVGTYGSDAQISVSAALTFAEGIVIAYTIGPNTTDNDGYINFVTGGSLTSSGTVESPVLITSASATCEGLYRPKTTDYNYGLLFSDYTPASLSHVLFSHGRTGISAEYASASAFRSLSFSHMNSFGIAIRFGTTENTLIQNCIFRDMQNAVWIKSKSQARIEFCTFDDINTSGILLDRDGADSDNTVYADHNIFTKIDTAALKCANTAGKSYLYANTNLFWGVNDQTTGIFTDLSNTNAITHNPLYCSTSAASYTQDVFPDGYYLSQNTGDQSRTPLWLEGMNPIDDITVSIADCQDGDMIEIFGYEGLDRQGANPIYRYIQANPVPTKMPVQSQNDVDCLLVYYADGERTFIGGDYVDLDLLDGRVIRAYMPAGTYGGEPSLTPTPFALPLWVAEDGSTFWAQTDVTPVADTTPTVDQDAVYSMRYDDDAPAKSANSTGTAGDSPAVDAGVCGSSAGTTSAYPTPTLDTGILDLGFHYAGGVTPCTPTPSPTP